MVPVFNKSDLFENEGGLLNHPSLPVHNSTLFSAKNNNHPSFHQDNNNNINNISFKNNNITNNNNNHDSLQLKPTAKPMLITLVLLAIYDICILTVLTITGFEPSQNSEPGIYQKLWPVLLLTSKGIVLLVCIWVSWVLRRHAPQLSSPTNNALLSCAILATACLITPILENRDEWPRLYLVTISLAIQMHTTACLLLTQIPRLRKRANQWPRRHNSQYQQQQQLQNNMKPTENIQKLEKTSNLISQILGDKGVNNNDNNGSSPSLPELVSPKGRLSEEAINLISQLNVQIKSQEELIKALQRTTAARQALKQQQAYQLKNNITSHNQQQQLTSTSSPYQNLTTHHQLLIKQQQQNQQKLITNNNNDNRIQHELNHHHPHLENCPTESPNTSLLANAALNSAKLNTLNTNNTLDTQNTAPKIINNSINNNNNSNLFQTPTAQYNPRQQHLENQNFYEQQHFQSFQNRGDGPITNSPIRYSSRRRARKLPITKSNVAILAPNQPEVNAPQIAELRSKSEPEILDYPNFAQKSVNLNNQIKMQNKSSMSDPENFQNNNNNSITPTSIKSAINRKLTQNSRQPIVENQNPYQDFNANYNLQSHFQNNQLKPQITNTMSSRSTSPTPSSSSSDNDQQSSETLDLTNPKNPQNSQNLKAAYIKRLHDHMQRVHHQSSGSEKVSQNLSKPLFDDNIQGKVARLREVIAKANKTQPHHHHHNQIVNHHHHQPQKYQTYSTLPAMHSTRAETRGIDPETSKARDLSLQKLPKVSPHFSNFNSSTKTSQSEAVVFDKNSASGSTTLSLKILELIKFRKL